MKGRALIAIVESSNCVIPVECACVGLRNQLFLVPGDVGQLITCVRVSW